MRIAIALTPPTDLFFKWSAQIGVSDFVSRYPAHYGLDPIKGLSELKKRAERFGLKVSVVEGYLPLKRVVRGQEGRDEDIAEISRFIRHMGELRIKVLCYNFMLNDWTRTHTNVVTRGGAITNGFDLSKVRGRVGTSERISSEQAWDNLEYLLKRIVPVAEDAGVKLAMHPDDPPLPLVKGAAQIMYSPACFDRLFQMNKSPVNGMCFCQGTFSEMGVDIPKQIGKFGKRIHYVHFRDVKGSAEKFEETFHDAGQTDMVAAMKAYKKIGYTGAARPDHVPKLEGEAGDGGGYTMLGRLFAVGYMRGLIQAVFGAAREGGKKSAGDAEVR